MTTTPITNDTFWNHVKVGDVSECWEWQHTRNAYGYGVFYRTEAGTRRCHIASRYAHALRNGGIPEGHWVLHSCDNPPCCNPAHLRTGTPAENSADMKARGRFPVGSKTRAARLNEELVYEIRCLYEAGDWAQAQLAKKYGVGQMTISWLVRGVTWKHVPFPPNSRYDLQNGTAA